jgi:hypothetical protein
MSKIRTYVIDADTEDPIQDATIYLLNSDGTRNKVLATTDVEGTFEFEAPAFGSKVEIDFPGYSPTVLDPAYIWNRIALTPESSNTGENVIVKNTRGKIKKPNYTLPIVLGSAAVVMIGVWMYKKFA